jgi:cell division septation protein DedD
MPPKKFNAGEQLRRFGLGQRVVRGKSLSPRGGHPKGLYCRFSATSSTISGRLKVYPALHPGHLFPGDGHSELRFVNGDRGGRWSFQGNSHLASPLAPASLKTSPSAGLARPSRPYAPTPMPLTGTAAAPAPRPRPPAAPRREANPGTAQYPPL